MATNKINTRIVIRNDTYTNWSANNPVLLKGEVAIVTGSCPNDNFDSNDNYYIVVGDGTSAFNSLSPIYANTITKLAEENNKAALKIVKTVATESDLVASTGLKAGDVVTVTEINKKYIILADQAEGTTDPSKYELSAWVALAPKLKTEIASIKQDISNLTITLETTKTELEDKIKEQVASVFRFKGTVSDLTALKAIENPAVGDVYHVTATHTEYVYATVDGNETASWEELGSEGLYALKTDFDAEVTRAKAEEKTLADDIAAEITRATGAETTLTDKVNSEVTRATGAEKTLSERIAALEASATPVDGTTIVRAEDTGVISVGTISETNLTEDLKIKINNTIDTDSSLAIDTNSKLTVNEVTTDKLIQGDKVLVLDGGTAN